MYDVDNDGDIDIVGQDTYANNSKPYVYENLLDPVDLPIDPPSPPVNLDMILAPIYMLFEEK